MNSTKAVDVRIHDVSPELSSSAEILKEISNTKTAEINTFTSAPKKNIYIFYMQSLCHINIRYLHIKRAKKREELYLIALLYI
tara:strand:+ start:79 stop:327 length:249 start_codon:yes stop_codon:yes gene_type:complete